MFPDFRIQVEIRHEDQQALILANVIDSLKDYWIGLSDRWEEGNFVWEGSGEDISGKKEHKINDNPISPK